MNIKKRVLATVIGALGAVALQAQAGTPYDQMIAFGASFEDVGQFPDVDFVSVAFPGLVAPPGAALDGSTGFRLTNIDAASGERGRAWIEMLAADLGVGGLVPSTPLLYPGARTDIPATGNLNFSYAGGRARELLEAVTGTSTVVHPTDALVPADLSATSPGFLQRLQAGTLTIGPRTLFVVNPAGNDVRDSDPADPAAAATRGAQDSLELIRSLVGAGAQTIVVPTFPPLGLLPESTNLESDGSRSAKAEARNAGAATYNAVMAAGLPGTGGNIVIVDWATLFQELLAAPATFGFGAGIDQSRYCYSASEWSVTGVDCTEAPGLGKSSGGNPDDFVTNDGLHPTQPTARILADYTASVLRAPGMVSLLPEAVLADARGHRATVDDFLAQNRFATTFGDAQVFVAAQGQRSDLDETRGSPDARADSTDLTVGGSIGIAERWFAGMALGSRQGDTDLDGSGSAFDTDGLLGSVFAGYRHDGWFADLVLTVGGSDLDDIERVFALGSVQQRRESGDTSADVSGLSATLGVDMMGANAGWRFGPFLQADHLAIEVDGYAERGASSTAMQFDDLDRDSTVGSAGVFASYPCRLGGAELEFYGDAAYEHEFDDDPDAVRAVLKSAAGVVWFTTPGYRVEQDGWRARAGVDANWSNGVRLGLSYRFADHDAQAQYLNVSAAYRF